MARIKIGVIGCGSVAQIRHLPSLRELPHLFEIAGLCDLSPRLLERVGDDYGVPPERRFTDYRDLLRGDAEAVIVCNFGSHVPPTLAALAAGRHVLVEKPACTTVAEAEAMAEAAERAGLVLLVGYMKCYDSGYQYARERVGEMADVRFIRVSQLHPDNTWHPQLGSYYDPRPVALAQELDPSNVDFPRAIKLYRFNDIPAGVREAEAADHRRRVAEALGLAEASPMLRRAFSLIAGSMIHDIGALHGLFGAPRRVVNTEIWADGAALTTTLEYDGDRRCVVDRVDLPDVWDWEETLGVYGSRERVIVSFPHGLSRGLPTTVTVHGAEADGQAWKKELAWHDVAFTLELRHFAECIRDRVAPLTPGRQASADMALVRDVILAYLRGQAAGDDGRPSATTARAIT